LMPCSSASAVTEVDICGGHHAHPTSHTLTFTSGSVSKTKLLFLICYNTGGN
jgi:hypothetical protein